MTEQPMILVAIADDHYMIRHGLKDLLNCIGSYSVTIEAGDGAELLNKISGAATPPDICLVDISMPVMDGYETARQLKEKWPQIKCIALSLKATPFTILYMMKSGALCFLHKMASATDIKTAFTEVYTNGYYFPEFVKEKIPGITPANILRLAKELHSEREIELLRYCYTGLTNLQIAKKMNLSDRTIENDFQKLHDKLDIHTRHGLVKYATEMGIVGAW